MDGVDCDAYDYYLTVEKPHNLAVYLQDRINHGDVDSSAYREKKNEYMREYTRNLELTKGDSFRSRQYKLGKYIFEAGGEKSGKKRRRATEEFVPNKKAKRSHLSFGSPAAKFGSPGVFGLAKPFKSNLPIIQRNLRQRRNRREKILKEKQAIAILIQAHCKRMKETRKKSDETDKLIMQCAKELGIPNIMTMVKEII